MYRNHTGQYRTIQHHLFIPVSLFTFHISLSSQSVTFGHSSSLPPRFNRSFSIHLAATMPFSQCFSPVWRALCWRPGCC